MTLFIIISRWPDRSLHLLPVRRHDDLAELTNLLLQVACALVDQCGRFLYRNPETHVRTKNMVLSPYLKSYTKLKEDEEADWSLI